MEGLINQYILATRGDVNYYQESGNDFPTEGKSTVSGTIINNEQHYMVNLEFHHEVITISNSELLAFMWSRINGK